MRDTLESSTTRPKTPGRELCLWEVSLLLQVPCCAGLSWGVSDGIPLFRSSWHFRGMETGPAACTNNHLVVVVRGRSQVSLKGWILFQHPAKATHRPEKFIFQFPGPQSHTVRQCHHHPKAHHPHSSLPTDGFLSISTVLESIKPGPGGYNQEKKAPAIRVRPSSPSSIYIAENSITTTPEPAVHPAIATTNHGAT